jgi:hypothetical protein
MTKGKGKGNLKAIHHFRKHCGDSKSMHEKNNPYNPSMGTGGAWAAISWPEAVAVTTWTVNLYGPAHLCRSLMIDKYVACFEHLLQKAGWDCTIQGLLFQFK